MYRYKRHQHVDCIRPYDCVRYVLRSNLGVHEYRLGVEKYLHSRDHKHCCLIQINK